MLQSTRRLPGIRFEAQPPPAAFVLPRMDVAGFVGYAASGPLDIPVPVEDAARFADVFGDDLAIAWDAARLEPAYAALGPAVRSFFRNGGRRCYVVRVAGAGARTTVFQLPGVVAVADDESMPRHALLRARSPGAWPDGLRVAVSVASSPLAVRKVSPAWDTFDVASPGGVAVRPGDLIRLTSPGDRTLLAAVAPPAAGERAPEERDRPTLTRVTAGPRLWTQPAELAPGPLGRAQWVGPYGALRTAGVEVVVEGGRILLRVNTALERGPAEGSLVRLAGAETAAWARIHEREPARTGTGVLLAFDALRISTAPPPGLPGRGPRIGQRLELELWVEGRGQRRRLGGLGFAPGHPRFVGDLPTDEALYANAAVTPEDEPELWRAAREPRFPLAGPEAPPAAYFPVAASLLPRPWLSALPPGGTVQRRNGLESFRSSVFLDGRLAGVRTPALLAQADDLRYGAGRREPARLHGLHALLGVDEVTLVAVPDAAQPGWSRGQAPVAFPPPALEHVRDASGGDVLGWDPAPAGAEIEVDEGADVGFETPVTLYRGTRRSIELTDRPAQERWYRARFVTASAEGPYAVVGPIGAAPGAFTSCEPAALPTPVLTLTGDPASGRYGLGWGAPPAGAEIELDEATDPAFETAVELYRGTRPGVELGARPPGAHWYRARFVRGSTRGSYGAIGPVGASPRPPASLRPPESYADAVLLAVHRALARMCAARGDLFALLAMPEHYREDASIGHAARLRAGRALGPADVPPLGDGEARALSYAALHHPWLITTNEDRPGELRRVPPDGAAAGTIARRAVERGSWVAPANLELLDVVALSPEAAPERRLELLEAHVNVFERSPRGFRTLAADTLATDPDLRPINVRRLLQLLRRLALRHGETYAFEPNDETLRRSAQRGFEAVLDVLFGLGAFAGISPDDAFQVVTGSPPNTPQSVDAGRLIVELRVAPSRPLAFITVRLVRAGDGRLTVETG